MCEFGDKLGFSVIVEPFAFHYYLDMSHSRQKLKRDDNGKADAFIWSEYLRISSRHL